MWISIKFHLFSHEEFLFHWCSGIKAMSGFHEGPWNFFWCYSLFSCFFLFCLFFFAQGKTPWCTFSSIKVILETFWVPSYIFSKVDLKPTTNFQWRQVQVIIFFFFSNTTTTKWTQLFLTSNRNLEVLHTKFGGASFNLEFIVWPLNPILAMFLSFYSFILMLRYNKPNLNENDSRRDLFKLFCASTFMEVK